MRLGLAPLAAAVGVTGAISISVAVTSAHPHPRGGGVTATAAPSYFHDIQPAAVPGRAPQPGSDDQVVRPPIASPSCPGAPSVHFETPQAAMRFLASAWNRNDVAALCQVTNPNARLLLLDMHRQALNLRLLKCTRVEVGHYGCTFAHNYPPRMHMRGQGRAYVDVAAARDPGWYMTVYVGCG